MNMTDDRPTIREELITFTGLIQGRSESAAKFSARLLLAVLDRSVADRDSLSAKTRAWVGMGVNMMVEDSK